MIIICKMHSLILYPLEEGASETFTAAGQNCPHLECTHSSMSFTAPQSLLLGCEIGAYMCCYGAAAPASTFDLAFIVI